MSVRENGGIPSALGYSLSNVPKEYVACGVVDPDDAGEVRAKPSVSGGDFRLRRRKSGDSGFAEVHLADNPVRGIGEGRVFASNNLNDVRHGKTGTCCRRRWKNLAGVSVKPDAENIFRRRCRRAGDVVGCGGKANDKGVLT